MNKLQTYKQQLHDFTTNNTTIQDTTYTDDELLTIMTNTQTITNNTNHNTHNNTLTDIQKPITFTNFYLVTRLQK